MGNSAGRNRLFATDIGTGVAAGVSELYGGFSTLGADGAREPRQARQEAIVENAELVLPVAPTAFGRGHLDGDEANAAARGRCSRRWFGL
jgi:hypothetical protein